MFFSGNSGMKTGKEPRVSHLCYSVYLLNIFINSYVQSVIRMLASRLFIIVLCVCAIE